MEVARIILGLRIVGWDEEAINNFLIFLGTGDMQHLSELPHPSTPVLEGQERIPGFA